MVALKRVNQLRADDKLTWRCDRVIYNTQIDNLVVEAELVEGKDPKPVIPREVWDLLPGERW